MDSPAVNSTRDGPGAIPPLSPGLLERARATPRSLSRAELAALLAWPDEDALFAAALDVKRRAVGRRVSIRGLLEIGNVCAKNCFYCGIRKDNADVRRYAMDAAEIVAAAKWAHDAGYGSVVLQSGEIEGEAHSEFIEGILREIHAFGGDDFGITLSLGEQTEDTFRRWRQAGAHRYLLRIETSSPALYATLHPADHSWTRRRNCLRALRKCGYQVGTGVMIGLPGQLLEDLADDILFFASEDIDMIGMGPFIPHPATPVGRSRDLPAVTARDRLDLGLRMIAATRLHLHDVNIAAATALQALDPEGREKGLLAGANVIMPNITPPSRRADYQLYPGKPCLGENGAICRDCIARRVEAIGEEVAWGVRADSPRWARRAHD